jgi:hypothetical protein
METRIAIANELEGILLSQNGKSVTMEAMKDYRELRKQARICRKGAKNG